MNKKRCNKCDKIKIVTDYYKNKKNRDGLEYTCKRCSSRRYYNNKKNKDGLYDNDKKIKEHWIYGDGDCIKNKQYLKDRTELFNKYGNGWWWFQGFNQQGRGKNARESHQERKRGIRGRFTQK
jgi:hypothetical protein